MTACYRQFACAVCSNDGKGSTRAALPQNACSWVRRPSTGIHTASLSFSPSMASTTHGGWDQSTSEQCYVPGGAVVCKSPLHQADVRPARGCCPPYSYSRRIWCGSTWRSGHTPGYLFSVATWLVQGIPCCKFSALITCSHASTLGSSFDQGGRQSALRPYYFAQVVPLALSAKLAQCRIRTHPADYQLPIGADPRLVRPRSAGSCYKQDKAGKGRLLLHRPRSARLRQRYRRNSVAHAKPGKAIPKAVPIVGTKSRRIQPHATFKAAPPLAHC